MFKVIGFYIKTRCQAMSPLVSHNIYRSIQGDAEIASTGKRKYGKRKYRIPVNTNCGDYNGTPIACRMSISLAWFLSTGWSKNGTISVRLYQIVGLTDFQSYFTVGIRRKFVIVLSLKIPPHLTCSLHYLVKYQCIKSNNWKQDDFLATYFTKSTTENNVFIVSVIV